MKLQNEDLLHGLTVEELSRLLHVRRITSPLFRLSISKADAEKLLQAAYLKEVGTRQIAFSASPLLKELIAAIAASLTEERGCTGMLFIGTCGSGKTTMLRAIQSMTCFLNERDALRFPDILSVKDSKEIVSVCKSSSNIYAQGEIPMLGIDDFGDEPKEITEFGNVRTPLVDLLEYRYDRQRFTIITSNLTMDEIRSKYGIRLLNRFAEMGRFFIFPEVSYRVPKLFNVNDIVSPK